MPLLSSQFAHGKIRTKLMLWISQLNCVFWSDYFSLGIGFIGQFRHAVQLVDQGCVIGINIALIYTDHQFEIH